MLNDLYEACLKFRKAINRAPKDNLSINFKEFSNGSCGDTYSGSVDNENNIKIHI